MSSKQDETKLETPHLSATVLQHGHHFTSLVVRGSEPDAPTTDCLGGFADLDAYHNSVTRAFFNCIVGRYANRLPAGESAFRTGAKIQLGGAEGVCLHGGDSGLDTLPWIPIARADSSLFDLNDPAHPIPPPAADPNAPVTESSVLHRLISPGGADGFPCSLECECLTVVYAPETAKGVETDVEHGKKGRSLGKLKVVMRAKIRQDGDEGIPKGTPVNLTVHWGFRLDDGKEENILNHHLFLDSDKLVALDEKALATGKIDHLEKGNGYDFYSHGREGPHRKIGDGYPEGGIDVNYLLNLPESGSPPEGEPLLPTKPQAILTAPISKSSSSSGHPRRLQLRFTSSAPSVQMYTAPGWDTNGPARKPAHGGPQPDELNPVADAAEKAHSAGLGYAKDGMVFLEFQHPVGAVLHTAGSDQETELGGWLRERAERRELDLGEGKGGKSWEVDTLLRDGQVYENWTEIEVVEVDE
ncbi:hypothetical protein JCM3774_002087 [Rhodotorula dairenensis]